MFLLTSVITISLRFNDHCGILLYYGIKLVPVIVKGGNVTLTSIALQFLTKYRSCVQILKSVSSLINYSHKEVKLLSLLNTVSLKFSGLRHDSMNVEKVLQKSVLLA